MFRATALSIVLTLVAWPNTGLLCKAWCQPAAAAAANCHHAHGNASAVLTGTEDCDKPMPNSAVVVKGDARRSATSSDARQAVIVPRHPPPIFASEAHRGHAPGCPWSLAQRSLFTALRI